MFDNNSPSYVGIDPKILVKACDACIQEIELKRKEIMREFVKTEKHFLNKKWVKSRENNWSTWRRKLLHVKYYTYQDIINCLEKESSKHWNHPYRNIRWKYGEQYEIVKKLKLMGIKSKGNVYICDEDFIAIEDFLPKVN